MLSFNVFHTMQCTHYFKELVWRRGFAYLFFNLAGEIHLMQEPPDRGRCRDSVGLRVGVATYLLKLLPVPSATLCGNVSNAAPSLCLSKAQRENRETVIVFRYTQR